MMELLSPAGNREALNAAVASSVVMWEAARKRL